MEQVLTDEVLVARSLNGDHEAYEQLVHAHQRMIHALTFRMSGSTADAEDLAQEIFIRAYRNLHTFQGGAKFSTWLYRIGINTCLNWKKSVARRIQLHQDWADKGDDAECSNNLTDKVQAALQQLNPKQRAAIVLTVYDGMNHAEAARVLGCSETTVSWRVFMARKLLKNRLASPER